MECSRGIAMGILSVCPSVRPSVCLSVKRVHCDKTEESYVAMFRFLHHMKEHLS